VEFNLDQFQIDAVESIKKDFNVLVIKALSNQKYNDFLDLGIDTGLLTGDRTISPDSELIVATTEILRNMIYANDKRLEKIGLIVLDEVHYLSDSERGTTWEEIIIHAPTNIKFLFLSATIRNNEEFHKT